jgi:hypothetical protein
MKSLNNGSLDFLNQKMKNPLAEFMPWLQRSRYSAGAVALCKSLVEPNAGARITAQEALATPWLQEAAENMRERYGKENLPQQGANNAPRITAQAQKELHHKNHALIAQLEDQEAALRVSRQREKLLLDMMGDKGREAPKTLCAPKTQGRLARGTTCRYWSTRQRSWFYATIERCNEDDGTYDLDVKARVPLCHITPRSDAKLEEAWPRGTHVTYKSTSSGKDVPAVVISFKVGAKGEGTYNLDVRDGAEVSRISPRIV